MLNNFLNDFILLFIQQQSVYIMNNLKLTIEPYELQYSSAQSLSIILIYRKTMISTGALLQKYECKNAFALKNGSAIIKDKFSFQMDKQVEMKNYQLIIQVMSKKEKQFLGQVALDIYTILAKSNKECQFKLAKSRDTHAYLCAKIYVEELPISLPKKKSNGIVETGLLQTQSFQKEKIILDRRVKHDLPTAYEISRRNYKNVEINGRNSNQSRNKSYKKRYEQMTNLNKTQMEIGSKHMYQNGCKTQYQTHQSSKNSIDNGKKSMDNSKKGRSPSPRLKTPQPITFNDTKKIQNQNKNYKIDQKNQNLEIKQRGITKYEVTKEFISIKVEKDSSQSSNLLDEDIEYPQTFRGKPYSCEHPLENIQNRNENIPQSAEKTQLLQQKGNKYKMITQKLEQIENKIKKEREKYHSENNFSQSSSNVEDDSQSNDTFQMRQSNCSGTFNNVEIYSHDQSFNEAIQQQKDNIQLEKQKMKILKSSGESHHYTSSEPTQMHQKSVQIPKNISQSNKFSQITISPKQTTKEESKKEQIKKEETKKEQPKHTFKQDNQSKQDKSTFAFQQRMASTKKSYETQIRNLQSQNQELVKQIQKKNAFYFNRNQDFTRLESQLKQKDDFIHKISKLYDEEMQKNFYLKKEYEDKCQKYAKDIQVLLSKNLQLQQKIQQIQLKKSKPQANKNIQSAPELNYKEQYLLQKKKCVTLQTQLRYKQNDIKFLKIQKDNLIRMKRDLQQQIDIITSKNNTEMNRKGSISKLNLVNNSVSASIKLENQALKSEVIVLKKQIDDLNRLIQGKTRKQSQKSNDIQYSKVLEKKCLALQQKSTALEEQLTIKKQQFADIINLIWKNGNGELMDEVDHYISQP